MKTENKQAVKNMEYWKKKNNIPGIEALADAGLTDGRARSSAFQMATPGDSPNKFSLARVLTGGMLGKGGWGKDLMKGNFKGAFNKAINPMTAMGLDNSQNILGMGGPAQPTLGVPGSLPVPAVAANPAMQTAEVDPKLAAAEAAGVPLTMKKSPFQKEGEDYVTSGMPEILYKEDGRTLSTTDDIDEGSFTRIRKQIESDLLLDEETGLEYIEATEDSVNYKKGERLYLENPTEVAEKQVPQAMGPGGMEIPKGGVGAL